MVKSYRIIITEVIKCMMATILIGIGVAMFISCELGSDSLTVFLDGVNRSFHIPVSIVNQLTAIVILLLAYHFNKAALGYSTIINVLIVGICIEIGTNLVFPLHLNQQSLTVRIAMMFFAQIILALGYAWMQTFSSGMSYTDALIYGIANKLNTTYLVVRVVYDGMFIITGYLLHGIVGVGSIFSILTLGLFISVFKKMFDKINNRKTLNKK